MKIPQRVLVHFDRTVVMEVMEVEIHPCDHPEPAASPSSHRVWAEAERPEAVVTHSDAVE